MQDRNSIQRSISLATGWLFNFDGRLSRLVFWKNYLVIALAVAAVWAAGLFAVLGIGAAGAVVFLLFVPLIIRLWSVGLRRAHDRGRGVKWWLLVSFGPFVSMVLARMTYDTGATYLAWVGFIVGLAGVILSWWGSIELGFRRGTKGANPFGPAS